MSDDEPDVDIRVAASGRGIEGLGLRNVNAGDRQHDMNLWANEIGEGVWLFYCKPKAESDEEGAVGHA